MSTVAPTCTPPAASPIDAEGRPAPHQQKCWRRVLSGLLLGSLLALGWEAVDVLCGANFHCVVPGELYRSAQPSPQSLRRMMQQHGIRTVFNLRGFTPDESWCAEEHQAIEACGGCCYDLGLSASFPPHPLMLQRLVRLFDRAERPLLLHCYSGSDRTGLAVAVYLLLYTDASVADAREQLHWRYGHFAIGHKACQLRVLDQYSDWLASESQQHSAEHLRRWIQYFYRQEASSVVPMTPVKNGATK